MLNVSPEMLRQAISEPAVKPVPKSAAKLLEKLISIAEVIELLAELSYAGNMSLFPTKKVKSNSPFASPSLGIKKLISGTDK